MDNSLKERDTQIEEALIRDILAGKETPLVKRTLAVNRVIKHNYKVEHNEDVTCKLEGCSKTFQITIFPNQILYPKYCPTHKSKFQRDL